MVYIESDYFDLDKIADSGQCFRWLKIAENEYIVPLLNRELRIEQSGNKFALGCTQEDYDTVWCDYFDMGSNYKQYHDAALNSGLPYLVAAAEYSIGVRILRQDIWETALSFIISQNNNIKRIQLCLNRIVERFGKFPDAADIIEGSLEGLKLGYREKYMYDLAKLYTPGFTDFASVKGVGPKVLNCIELFGLAKKNAFPRDVWIKRIEQDHFNGRFPEERFEGFAGVMQQYLFYYARKHQD